MTSSATLVKSFRTFVAWLWDVDSDPVLLRYGALVNVWARCAWVAATLVEITYPAGYQDRYYVLSVIYVLTHACINGFFYYRLRGGRTVPARWLLVMSAVDVINISFSVSVSGGFDSKFYPAYILILAMHAVVFASVRLSCAWTTLVAAVYVALCCTVSGGLDLQANEEKYLFQRILMMYVAAGVVSLIAKYERGKRQEAVAREQRLQRERIELSQTIHDTVGQSAYMIGMGIDNAKELAGASNSELLRSLDATGNLSRSAMWSLRHPIDVGVIFDGQALGTTLSSHAATFTAITSIPAEVSQLGSEPPLPLAARSMLFSIAHNAMTNVFRHAEAGRVDIVLDFQPDWLRMSVCDDGRGLPEGYERHGHGFRNMRTEAERLGGSLEVRANEGGVGTAVVCEIPLARNEGGS